MLQLTDKDFERQCMLTAILDQYQHTLSLSDLNQHVRLSSSLVSKKTDQGIYNLCIEYCSVSTTGAVLVERKLDTFHIKIRNGNVSLHHGRAPSNMAWETLGFLQRA